MDAFFNFLAAARDGMIFLECDNDEAVVRGLGFPRGAVEHHASKGRVAKFLQKAAGGNHFGLVGQCLPAEVRTPRRGRSR